MTNHLLLLGAGFSRNWGGWLADEAFEYLLGLPELQSQPAIINLLWKHQHKGGFEGALEELQVAAGRGSASPHDRAALQALEDAVVRMFADMNAAFLADGFDLGRPAREFLTRFDAIYTLNQDILLERRYAFGTFPRHGDINRWHGVQLPGVTSPYAQAEYQPERWLTEHWTLQPQVPPTVAPHLQPIFKLHGSSLWRRDEGGRSVLIVGGQKAGAIARDPLLSWYSDHFAQALKTPDTRLMIIGYGFRDSHINDAIKAGFGSGLTVFNISPQGADAWTETPGAGPGNIRGRNYLADHLIGASRRGIREVVDPSSPEFGKVLRFFR